MALGHHHYRAATRPPPQTTSQNGHAYFADGHVSFEEFFTWWRLPGGGGEAAPEGSEMAKLMSARDGNFKKEMSSNTPMGCMLAARKK